MEKKGISQEGLKLLACITMLIDHVGYVFALPIWFRVVGRLAFPIFCFLMAEGVAYTRNAKKYGLRLFIGVLLSELPFDIVFFGQPTWAHQSVMVTLLLGFLALEAMKQTDQFWLKLLLAIPFSAAADLLHTDYSGNGVLLVCLFGLVRDLPYAALWQCLGTAVMCWLIGGYRMPLFGIRVPIELFGVFALIPILCYHGKKRTKSKALQWIFYLYYPAHIALIGAADWILRTMEII